MTCDEKRLQKIMAIIDRWDYCRKKVRLVPRQDTRAALRRAERRLAAVAKLEGGKNEN